MLHASTPVHFGKDATRPAIPSLTPLPDGQAVSVEFLRDEDVIEIGLIESCGAVAGSVFIPVDQVSNLIKQLRRAVPK
jgi:hypothetical protein